MTGWAAKRFWAVVEVAETGRGFEIRLDGRPLRTPARAPLSVPTRALAARLAAEWQAQDERIDPASMPSTRMANTAIDRVAPRRGSVLEQLLAYGATDLLCYRAEAPEGLAARQADAWDPWLDWAAARFGARLSVTRGVLPVAQPEDSLHALRAAMAGFDAFELAALSELVSLPASLILGLAAFEGRETPEALWRAGRLDELWQIAQWGADAEAERANAIRYAAFEEAARFAEALRQA